MTNKVQWKTLPTQANRDMEQAGADAAREYLERTGSNNLWVIYEAMAAAAPKPPASIEPVTVALVAEDKYQETDVIQCDGIHSLPVGTELIDRAAYDLCRAEVLQLVAALDLVGQGLSIADGAKNVDAMRQEIHELQERDLDQLALLVESKDLLQRLAAEEKLRGSTPSAAELESLAREIGVHSIEPITDGTRPLSRLTLQRDLAKLAAELTKARCLLHTASVHLSRWVDVDDLPRQQIIEFLEGSDTPVERDERAEFEAAYAKEFSKVRGQDFTAEDIASMRDSSGGYGDRSYLNGQWVGWQARAALENSND